MVLVLTQVGEEKVQNWLVNLFLRLLRLQVILRVVPPIFVLVNVMDGRYAQNWNHVKLVSVTLHCIQMSNEVVSLINIFIFGRNGHVSYHASSLFIQHISYLFRYNHSASTRKTRAIRQSVPSAYN